MANEKKSATKTETPPVVPTAVVVGPLAPAATCKRVRAPVGMESISVGGLQFPRDGDGFLLPPALVAAAVAHIKSFENAAEREAARIEDEARRLVAEADVPGRFKALEQRLAALEEMLGQRG